MSDRATASLNEILNSGNYVREQGIPIFDEHDEFDADGNLVRRFDKAKLDSIAADCNRRAKETGDLMPFGPGHTIPGAPETAQPRPWGFYTNCRVEPYGPAGKWAIVADRYVRRQVEVELPDGKVVERDGPKEVASYPRRSIEYWPKDNIIDWIAQLRRTPQRDLGLDVLACWKQGSITRPVDICRHYGAARNPIAAADVAGKLYYSMEQPTMADPAAAPDAKDPDQDFTDKVMRCIKGDPVMGRMYGECAQRYAAEEQPAPTTPTTTTTEEAPVMNAAPAAMSPTNAAPPAPVKKPDEDTVRMARESEAIRYAREVETLRGEVSKLRAERDADLQRYARADAERVVTQLEAEGFLLDRAKEVDRFAKLTDTERTERADEIRRYYRQDATAALAHGGPPTGPMLRIADNETAGTAGPNGRRYPKDERETKEVVRFMKESSDPAVRSDFNVACERYFRKPA